MLSYICNAYLLNCWFQWFLEGELSVYMINSIVVVTADPLNREAGIQDKCMSLFSVAALGKQNVKALWHCVARITNHKLYCDGQHIFPQMCLLCFVEKLFGGLCIVTILFLLQTLLFLFKTLFLLLLSLLLVSLLTFCLLLLLLLSSFLLLLLTSMAPVLWVVPQLKTLSWFAIIYTPSLYKL